MKLPEDLEVELAPVLGTLSGVTPVTGGCVASAARIEAGGRSYFLKFDRFSEPALFMAEAQGLERLAAAGTRLRIPAVVAVSQEADRGGWIVLEWLDATRPASDDWRRLGGGLAELHARPGERPGLDQDGFIGRLPQSNARELSWADFWRERRLRPQLAIARATPGIGGEAEWERLFERLPVILADVEGDARSLLHGDLWSGNVLFTAEGPAIVDPAAYYGHREVDLAMTRLFGGFPPEFYEAYEDGHASSASERLRRSVYQLYYLLVHVNLFGAAYASQTRRALRLALEAAERVA